MRTAVSRYQPSSTRLTKIQLLIYPIETKILNNNKTDNRFVIITDEIDPDMLMDTNNYSVIRGKWTAKSLEQQLVFIPDYLREILLSLSASYIKSKQLSIGDHLFHLERNQENHFTVKRYHKNLRKSVR